MRQNCKTKLVLNKIFYQNWNFLRHYRNSKRLMKEMRANAKHSEFLNCLKELKRIKITGSTK